MLILILIILFLTYLIIFSFNKNKRFSERIKEELKISVIVAAKNEEKKLPKLISSLQNQSYSSEIFEVIIVDDNSSDSTYEAVNLLIKDLEIFRIIKAENKKYTGKRGALQIGVENSTHDYFIITDADCIVSKDFIKSYSKMFMNKYDFVFGVSPFIQNNSWSNKIACFDNLWVHILSFSLAAIGMPYSASARSFGFSNKAFELVGGYRNTQQTLSGDDDLLLREAIKSNLKIGTITSFNARVYTESKKTIKEFIAQKSRHTSSSLYYSINVKLVLGTWHILNIIMVLSPFLVFISPMYISLFIIKLIGNVILIFGRMKNFGYKFHLFEIVVLQIVYEVFIIINFARGIFSKNRW